MFKHRTKLAVIAAAITGSVLLSASSCDTATPARDKQLAQSQAKFDDRTPPDVTGDAEYQNYIKAQEEVYDDPATIQWCTAFPSSPAAPIFTVPIAGKLTSSSVSYYPNHRVRDDQYGNLLIETQSVDGMYHGTPVPYRYGFTPGGQYVDFAGMEVFCTTALTEFGRQTLSVAQVAPQDNVTTQAEELLKSGDAAGAQALLDGAAK